MLDDPPNANSTETFANTKEIALRNGTPLVWRIVILASAYHSKTVINGKRKLYCTPPHEKLP
jgi:hypothetical protein